MALMLARNTLSRLWYDFVSCGHAFGVEHPEYRRVYLINAMMFIASLVFLFFSFFNLLLTGYYDIALMNLVCLLFSVALLIYLRKSRQVLRSAVLALGIVLGGLIAFVLLGQGRNYGLIWLTILPPFAFFLIGFKRGFLLVLVSWVALLMLLSFSAIEWAAWSFNYVTVVNIMTALLALMLVVAYYEFTRAEAAGKLAALNRTLQGRIERALEENIAQQKLLIQRSKMADLGEAFGMLAHQWKQPLTVVTLASDILSTRLQEEGSKEGELGYYARTIRDQVRFMAQTVDDFQAFMRPDRRCAPFGPYRALLRVVKLYGPVLKKREIDLVIEADRLAEQARVSGYENELMQTLLNLLTNASDAILKRRKAQPGHAGEIRLQLWCEGAWLKLRIEDNGSGVSEAIAPRLFELFATDKGESGNGLGLYMSRVIIERMGGTIALENHEDGAVVTIRLPIAAALG